MKKVTCTQCGHTKVWDIGLVFSTTNCNYCGSRAFGLKTTEWIDSGKSKRFYIKGKVFQQSDDKVKYGDATRNKSSVLNSVGDGIATEEL